MSATHLQHLRGKDEVLTNLALGYMQSDFIGERIMPVVYTDKEGIKVPVFGKGSLVEYETERAVGAVSNIITLDKSTTMPVVLEEHDLAAGVDYREQQESQFDEHAKATRRVTQGVQLRQEAEIARLIQTKSVYANAHSKDFASAKWTSDDADIQTIIDDAKEQVRSATGVTPKTLVLSGQVYSQIRRSAKLRSLISDSANKPLLNVATLKELLELDEILIGNAVSIPVGNKQTKPIWGNFASLIVRPDQVPSGNDEGVPAFGYTFRRRGLPVVDRYDGEGGKVQYVRYTDIRKAAVVGGACGFLFENVI